MNLATLHLLPEDSFHTGAQRFRSVDHHQIPPLQIQSAVYQIFQQTFDHSGVLRGSLPYSQNVLSSAFRDPQRHHQHLAAKVNAIDHQHHKINALLSSQPPRAPSGYAGADCRAAAGETLAPRNDWLGLPDGPIAR